MSFAQPYWLLAGLLACVFLLWRYRQFNRRQRIALAQFVSPRLIDKLTASVSVARRRLKQALVIAGVACLFVALARPQVGFHWQEVHRQGIQILVAVDTSKSMLTEDVKPNRLGRAKLAVDDLVNKLNGDGIGLIAFAGDSFLQCPVTMDYDAFRESVDSLDTNTIPRGGTDIGGAIREAQAVFNARPGTDKILLLITDGEDLGGDAVAAAQAAAKDGMKIFTVGVGTKAGELIPVPEANTGTDFVKDSAGQFVKSRLDESTLKQIADATGGMYEPLGQHGQGLTAIYDQGFAPFTRHEVAARQRKVYVEQFQWPLLAALLFFLGEMLIGTRKRGGRVASAGGEKAAIGAMSTKGTSFGARAAAMVGFAMFIMPSVCHASPTSAEKAYQKGDYSAAAKDYAASLDKQPKDPQLEFNLGSAAYKAGDYAKAVAAFQNTLNTTDVPVQQSAYYNLGNAQFRIGQKTAKSNPQDTMKTWQQAVQSYEAALQIKPGDTDAKFNHDLVKHKLEQLQKQQQQKNKDQQKDNQQNKDQQKDNQQNKDQQKDNQQNKGQQKDNQQNKDQQKDNQQNKDQQKDNQQNKGQQKDDQQNKGQQKDDQQNKGQQKDDQQNQGQGQQPQSKESQKGQQKPDSGKGGSQGKDQQPTQPNQQSAQNGQPKPEQGKEKGKPEQNQAGEPQSPKPQDQQEAGKTQGSQSAGQPKQRAQGERSEPGRMSKEEAKQLLDSLKGNEHNLPASQMGRAPVKPQGNQHLKDW